MDGGKQVSNGDSDVGGPDAPPGTQTLARGLDVLSAVRDGATDLKTVCAMTGIGRSTAHRLLQLLDHRGYLRSSQGTGYSLGPVLIELGFHALYQSPVPVIARPILEQLVSRYHDTVHLAVEDGGKVLYVDKISGSRGAEMRSRVGYRMPLSRTGIGKALLLDEPSRWASSTTIMKAPPWHPRSERTTCSGCAATQSRARRSTWKRTNLGSAV
jgi:DNA-binding IclR family transcriptional regulator